MPSHCFRLGPTQVQPLMQSRLATATPVPVRLLSYADWHGVLDCLQETADSAMAAQRVLSTTVGRSLSPGAQAELRALAATAMGALTDVPPGGGQPDPSRAAAAAAPTEAAMCDALDRAACCTAPSQMLPAPGLPPPRCPAPAADTALRGRTTSAAPVPHSMSTSAHLAAQFTEGTGAANGGPLETTQPVGAASQVFEHGRPALKLESRHEARRKLAFQPAEADIAEGGGRPLGRTVAVASDLATLAVDSSAPVRSILPPCCLTSSMPTQLTYCSIRSVECTSSRPAKDLL